MDGPVNLPSCISVVESESLMEEQAEQGDLWLLLPETAPVIEAGK